MSVRILDTELTRISADDALLKHLQHISSLKPFPVSYLLTNSEEKCVVKGHALKLGVLYMLLKSEDVDESSHGKNGEQDSCTCTERTTGLASYFLPSVSTPLHIPSCKAFRAMREICITACLTGSKQRPTDICRRTNRSGYKNTRGPADMYVCTISSSILLFHS